MNYFSHQVYKHDLKWYFNHFSCGRNCLVGEASPSYSLMRPSEICYLKDHYPDLKIIFLTRDPVDRMWSAIKRIWTFAYMEGAYQLGNDMWRLLKYMLRPSNLGFGMYASILKKWSRQFDEDQILHISYEDLLNNKTHVEAQVREFLKLDTFQLIDNPRNQSRIEKDVESKALLTKLLYKLYSSDISKFSETFHSTRVRNEKISLHNQKVGITCLLIYLGARCILLSYPIYYWFDDKIRYIKLKRLGY